MLRFQRTIPKRHNKNQRFKHEKYLKLIFAILGQIYNFTFILALF